MRHNTYRKSTSSTSRQPASMGEISNHFNGELDDGPLLAPDEADADAEEPKLLNLPVLCLDKILSSMDLVDLSHAADANIVLYEYARRVFGLNFADQIIMYDCMDIFKRFRVDLYRHFDLPHFCNHILDLTQLSLALNHFGDQIQRMSCCQDSFAKREATIDFDEAMQMISKKCKSLVEFKILIKHDSMTIDHAFPSVQKLTYEVIDDDVHHSWYNINQWFSNIKELTIFECHESNPQRHWFGRESVRPCKFKWVAPSKQHIPTLEHFTYKECNLDGVAEFLNVNPQLKTFKVHNNSVYGFRSLSEKIHWKAMSMAHLEFTNSISCDLDVTYIDSIKNIKFLTLVGFSSCWNIENLKVTQIEELTITNTMTTEANLIKFIVKQPNLQKLKVNTLHLDNLIQIGEKLSQLTDVTFQMNKSYHVWKTNFANGIYKMMFHCKRLQAVNFEYNEDIPKNLGEHQVYAVLDHKEYLEEITKKVYGNGPLAKKWGFIEGESDNEEYPKFFRFFTRDAN